ncbi:putative Holliday junction resolvase-like endonuclease [Roseovarius sp. MBR-79]|jgi:predicted Holliday junction resolvase-like endonuclease
MVARSADRDGAQPSAKSAHVIVTSPHEVPFDGRLFARSFASKAAFHLVRLEGVMVDSLQTGAVTPNIVALRDQVASLEAKLTALEKSEKLAPMTPRTWDVRYLGTIVTSVFVGLLYLLVFTGLGDLWGIQAGWVAATGEAEVGGAVSVNRDAVLESTRNMITVMGPIFIGLAIWMVTVVAERRLKTYDEALENMRQYLENRTDANRAYLERQVTALRTETNATIENGLARVQKTVEERIENTVKDSISREKDAFDKGLQDERQKLRETEQLIRGLADGIEGRFGHIAERECPIFCV